MMEHVTEKRLLSELASLYRRKSAFLDAEVTTSPVASYVDADRFAAERDRVFRRQPLMAAHSSELPEPGAFLRRTIAGLPLLLTRDRDGVAHAFLNVCRHRGTRLVDAHKGCRHRFSCPYHAWTWDSSGRLVGLPHGEQGFPDLDRGAFGLKELASREDLGWLWVQADGGPIPEPDTFLAGLGPDLAWFGRPELRLLHQEERVCRANWKLLVEGGIEAYHFRVAHRKTIAPHFPDNLSSYECFGPHMRSILPRTSIADLATAQSVATGDRQSSDRVWDMRRHANIVYTLFPLNQLLIQPAHVAWVQMEPLSADSTLIRLSTLAPAGTGMSEAEAAIWQRNHDITVTTLMEDFDIGESIQDGLTSGANDHLTFGRFEGALHVFNRTLDVALQTA